MLRAGISSSRGVKMCAAHKSNKIASMQFFNERIHQVSVRCVNYQFAKSRDEKLDENYLSNATLSSLKSTGDSLRSVET